MSSIDKIISTAKSQIGTCEPDGDDKYIKVYNELTGAKFGMDVAWCAIFVTWVMYMCGVAKDVVTRFASCTAGMKWFIKQGRWKNAKAYCGTYTPVPGILIFFSKGHKLTDPSHVGIVTKVTSTYRLDDKTGYVAIPISADGYAWNIWLLRYSGNNGIQFLGNTQVTVRIYYESFI